MVRDHVFYAPWMGLGNGDKSQINACASSPAVQMWHDECGAQASEFKHAVWPESSAAGIDGTLQKN